MFCEDKTQRREYNAPVLKMADVAPALGRYRNWVWTLNNYTEDEIAAIQVDAVEKHSFASQKCRYLVFQKEIAPSTGTPHLQGYAEFSAQISMGQLKAFLGSRIWCSRRDGPRNDARDYCVKIESRDPGTEPYEYGQWTATPGVQGKRSDLSSAISVLREGGIAAVAEEYPEVFVRNVNGLTALCRFFEGTVSDQHFEPRPWQSILAKLLDEQPDDRRVYWITDAQGGRGKSRLSRFLVAERGAVEFSGRVADMAFQLASTRDVRGEWPRIAIFDITRGAAEMSTHLYSFAEQLKNGRVVSSKYQSRMLFFPAMHVVFFSNSTWDREKWSHDRVYEVDLGMPQSMWPRWFV